MTFQLTKPDLQAFVDEQVNSGQYPTADAVIEAALELMRSTREYELDDADHAAIDEADAQFDRGEGRPWEELRQQLEARYLKRP